MDREAAAAAVAAFLEAIRHEPTGELAQTPALVAEAWCTDLLQGYGEDPDAILRDGSIDAAAGTGLVTLRSLDVVTMCPHHLLPAHGTAVVSYLPGTRIAGFGAIARALRAITRRFSLQEQAGATMAEALVSSLGATGAACRLRLAHTCLITRGAREPNAIIEPLAVAGCFAAAGPDRDLLLGALGS